MGRMKELFMSLEERDQSRDMLDDEFYYDQYKQKKPMKKLFLDDMRMPEDCKNFVKRLGSSTLYFKDNVDWDIVRTYNQFVEWIEKNGLPELISFDHDLADEHIQYYFGNGGHKNPPTYKDEPEFMEKTGMSCAKWLVDYCIDNKKTLPNFLVHSANPYGRENIKGLLESFKKHQSGE
jgi:hypothetical protein